MAQVATTAYWRGDVNYKLALLLNALLAYEITVVAHSRGPSSSRYPRQLGQLDIGLPRQVEQFSDTLRHRFNTDNVRAGDGEVAHLAAVACVLLTI